MHLLGEGIPHDPEEGIRLMTASAEQDYKDPMVVLLDAYREGKWGVKADAALAAEWKAKLEDYDRRNPPPTDDDDD